MKKSKYVTLYDYADLQECRQVVTQEELREHKSIWLQGFYCPNKAKSPQQYKKEDLILEVDKGKFNLKVNGKNIITVSNWENLNKLVESYTEKYESIKKVLPRK